MSRWRSPSLLMIGVLITFSHVFMPAAHADNLREYQWYLSELHIDEAHAISTGGGQVVAIIDTGVDGNHPALTGKLLPGVGIGDDAPAEGATDVAPQGHGTAMATIIAAEGDLLGVAPSVKILPVSLGDRITSDEMAEGIRWAVDHGATVVNLSLGATQAGAASAAESDAVSYALAHDVVVVAAAGNAKEQGRQVHSPGNIPGVVTVAGTDRDGGSWEGSAYGPQVVVAAPAQEIAGGVPPYVADESYQLIDGTSAAAALVSGTAALVRAKYPQLDAANVVNRLMSSASDVGEPGRDDQYGFGIIQPLSALSDDIPTIAGWPIATAVMTERAAPLRSKAVSRPETGTALSAAGYVAGAGAAFMGVIALVRWTARRHRNAALGEPPTRKHYWP